jgi:hypothetical protein
LIVGQRQAAIVEEASERGALAMSVAQRRAQHAALALDPLVLDGDPGKEGVGVRPQVQLPERPDLVRRLATPGAIQIEDPLDAQDALARDRILTGDRGLPQLAPEMRLMPSTA